MDEKRRQCRFLPITVLVLLACCASRAAAPVTATETLTPQQVTFFESKIRPVLVERCYGCHSTQGEKIRGALLLESRTGLRKGGESGAVIVPGDASVSRLILAIRHTDEKLKMPPKAEHRLSQEQVADFVAWVNMGAPDPRVDDGKLPTDPSAAFTGTERSLWSLQKVARPEVPAIRNVERVRNELDAFLFADLEAKGLAPNPPADRITLLRRMSLDLTGLPPTPREVERFLADSSASAVSSVVDRMLSSPHYGERWARHWLDLARFAESDGFKDDALRPNAWRYRDYVIRSFNADKPYDRFIREQIAGDELWPDDPEARIATAFNRHYPEEWNARNLYQRRQETLNDITDTVASVFTGLTVACARCHDHKYDPIRQADYYRLQAFFANTAAADNAPLLDEPGVKQYEQKLAAWEHATADVRKEMREIEEPKRQAAIKEYFDKYPREIQEILTKPAADRTPYERMMAARAGQYLDPASWAFLGRPEKVVEQLPADQKKRWLELKERLDAFAQLHPGEMPKTIAMGDLGPDAPPTRLLHRGNYDAPREEVQPGFLSVLDPAPAKVVPVAGTKSTGRRTALANALADPANPLTARVMVNRIWHYHFGRGIVGTPSDFGAKGEPPTHPKLLDWLADEFVRSGWSVKHVHRLIMNSATYQQSSAYHSAAAAVDPENRMLWKFPRQRLEAEIIRDSALAVAGLLNTKMFGASVYPELPRGVANRGGLWQVSPDEAERNRRSVYVFVRRNNRYPLFESFDAPDTLESCARRNMTTTPLQALTMLNNDLVLDWARAFAARVLAQSKHPERDAWATEAFRIAYGRAPREEELASVRGFFDRHRPIVAERAASGEKLALPSIKPHDVDAADAAVLVDLCHTLLNSNEFVYRN